MIKSYYKNGDIFLKPNTPVPSAYAIKTWVQNFDETGSALSKKVPRHVKTVCILQNVVAMREAFESSPRRSASRHAASLGKSSTSVRRILQEVK